MRLLAIPAFCIVITLQSNAGRAFSTEIYSTLTADTIPTPKRGGLTPRRTTTADTAIRPVRTNVRDTTPRRAGDTARRGDSLVNVTDTFSLRVSSETLDSPVDYVASDSGVLLVKDRKFILYGKTKTTYGDINLSAPRVEIDQATGIVTAVNSRDSLGNVLARAEFRQGSEGFQSDTIRYNFKTRRGLTQNTYTQFQDLFVNLETSKRVNDSTAYGKHFTISTCEYDHPHFGFVGSKAKFVTNHVAITGPIHPEFEGVPVPIYLPFGIFPLKQGRKSGLLPPQFTINEQFGLGLEGLGYYQVLNPYVDLRVQGSVYSYGGFSVNVVPSYRKRYRYNGNLNLAYQRTKIAFKGDPDFSVTKTFNINWIHALDQRARPGVNFSANVNAGSTRFNRFVTFSPNRPFQNQLTSSIAYSKTWKDKPFNLTLAANHNQNNNSHLINITLPDAGFTMNTIFPFQRKEGAGAAKWYEKLGVGYNGVARNQLSFIDTVKGLTARRLLDTLQWGAQHRFPINMSLPPAGPLLFSPFVAYDQTWLTRRIGRRWNPNTKTIDTLYDQKGLFIDHNLSLGVSLNTALFGTILRERGYLRGLRHVIRPTLNFSYKPNTSKRYHDLIQVDSSSSRLQPLSQFAGGNLFSGYGYGKFAGLTFTIDNNLEAKVRRKKDTADTKVRLLDGFGIQGGYNFMADSLRLQPLSLYARTTLFEKINITAQGNYNPYQQDSLNNYINRFVWQGNRFTLGRLNSGSVSLSANFQSKPRDPNKGTKPTNRQITDPNLMAEQERLQDYINRNPAEFVDFNIPWSLNLSFALSFTRNRNIQTREFQTDVFSSLNFNNSFSLTPKWNFTTNGSYDVKTGKLGLFSMTISRDMHCWQMSVGVTPIGIQRYFNITISPKSPILQDLKVNRSRFFTDY